MFSETLLRTFNRHSSEESLRHFEKCPRLPELARYFVQIGVIHLFLHETQWQVNPQTQCSQYSNVLVCAAGGRAYTAGAYGYRQRRFRIWDPFAAYFKTTYHGSCCSRSISVAARSRGPVTGLARVGKRVRGRRCEASTSSLQTFHLGLSKTTSRARACSVSANTICLDLLHALIYRCVPSATAPSHLGFMYLHSDPWTLLGADNRPKALRDCGYAKCGVRRQEHDVLKPWRLIYNVKPRTLKTSVIFS
jgi:hypothetical protein